MIYLIGGAPRLGKSIVAKRLMAKLVVSWMSTDALRDVLYETADPERRTALFPFAEDFSADRWLRRTTEEILKDQWHEGESMSKAIRAFVEHQADANEPFILEGVHILPELVGELQKDPKLNGQVRAMFIAGTDASVVQEGLRANKSPSDWLRGASDDVRKAVVSFAVAFSEKVEAEATRFGLPIFERTRNFDADMEAVINTLVE